jgi:DNA-binding beta-propeller fold protein YncE
VPVGSGPEGVVADPATGLVAVALRDPDAVALIDARRLTVRRRVPVPGAARHLALAAPAGPVLVPAERADRLAEIRLPGGRVTGARVDAYPHDAAAAGGRVFVGDERGSSVTVLEDGRVAGRIRVAAQPGGLAAADHGRAVAVVSVRERVLELYDTRTLRRIGRVPAGVGPTHVAGNGANRLYVVDTEGDALLVFALRPRLTLTRRLYLAGAPYGLAYDPEAKRLWATQTALNRVTELTAGARPRALRGYPAVRQPDSVAVEPSSGRVFVTGRVAGVLQAFDPPVLRRLRR